MKTFSSESLTVSNFRNIKKRGSVLITVVGVSSVLMMAGVSMTWISGNSALSARRHYQDVAALSLAEAGVADIINRMEDAYYANANTTIGPVSYGGGTYKVVSTMDGATGNILIKSTGTFQGMSKTTTIELLGDPWMAASQFFSSGGAIISGGDTILNSAAMEINGSVHAERNVLHSSGNTEIDGNLSAVGAIDAGVSVTGGNSITPGAPHKVVPSYLPFNEWEDLAKAGGLYYDASQSFSGDMAPANGVLYVNGDVTFSKGSLNGTLVASGSITVQNRFSQTSFNTNWPAMLAGVNLNYDNLNDAYGVLFAGNNFNSDNQKNFYGAIIALNGNVDIKNRCVLNSLNGALPPRSPAGSQPEPDPEIGGWLK